MLIIFNIVVFWLFRNKNEMKSKFKLAMCYLSVVTVQSFIKYYFVQLDAIWLRFDLGFPQEMK